MAGRSGGGVWYFRTHPHLSNTTIFGVHRLHSIAPWVPQPILSRSWAENGGKSGFWAAERPFVALHDLKSVLASANRLKMK